MGVTLYLLNKKGFISLSKIVEHKVYKSILDQVIIAKDKGNKEDYYNEIEKLAKEHSIRVYDRTENIKVESDYSIAIGWRWLINLNSSKLFVIHDSLLPKYRGFSPLVNMLINKEDYIGATMIFASKGMDEGDIIFQKKVKIDYPIKISKAIDLIADIYGELIEDLFRKLLSKNVLPSFKQNHSESSYSIWRDSSDYYIDWTLSADSIKRFIDSVGYPYEGARTKLKNEKNILIIFDAEVIENYTFELIHCGKIFKIEENKPFVVCGKDLLKITSFKDENGLEYKFNKLRTRLV
ncbi:methionyl-tRNA formyltransferase [Psychroflexus sediminis]|uniref:Methionyl-tRNA formyltransferase n=1 Tax=Psychroflexus sediminis TaxID=470826 RepID=A0A1G7UIJ9_9FLAO|nr:formyltransferase family protein [Psychroflexus sediminis]SDG47376.1 methionyl-tRNA formyltransferase [Psychroflexus sediminis]